MSSAWRFTLSHLAKQEPKVLPIPTYLFYDIETTGLNSCFDQVLQFAAIRTDFGLNEIDRTEIQVRLNCDVIPAPAAIITHRIGVNQFQSGITEYEAIEKIHALFNTPATISLGYNTLGFDDEFLRFGFYRHLLSPYTHQFASGCSRMDLYPITILYHLFQPEALEWPINNGKPSLKLEHLNEANQWVNGQSHTAMVDVEATLALARQLFQHRDTWDYACGYFNKKVDMQRIEQLPVLFETEKHLFREGILLQGRFGIKAKYHAPVLSLGQHLHYKNQTLWLRLDAENLTQTLANNVADTTYVIRKKLAEQEFILPPHERFMKHLDADRLALAIENKAWLQQNPKILQAICDYYQHYKYPAVPERDADAALYDIGFPTSRDEFLFKEFHKAKPAQKAKLLDEITQEPYHTLALRILGRHFPDALSQEHRTQFDEYLHSVLSNENSFQRIDYRRTPKLTRQKALEAITQLQLETTLDAQQKTLLNELEIFLLN